MPGSEPRIWKRATSGSDLLLVDHFVFCISHGLTNKYSGPVQFHRSLKRRAAATDQYDNLHTAGIQSFAPLCEYIMANYSGIWNFREFGLSLVEDLKTSRWNFIRLVLNRRITKWKFHRNVPNWIWTFCFRCMRQTLLSKMFTCYTNINNKSSNNNSRDGPKNKLKYSSPQ